MGRVGKPALEMRGEAIARNDVEAHAGHQRHAGAFRLGVAREKRLEHVDLAGDVEIMRAARETPVGHRPRRGGERPGGVEDDRNTFQRGVEPRPILKIERPPVEVELFRDRLERFGVSARQDDARLPRARLARDEFSSKAGRAVEENGLRHFAPLQRALLSPLPTRLRGERG